MEARRAGRRADFPALTISRQFPPRSLTCLSLHGTIVQDFRHTLFLGLAPMREEYLVRDQMFFSCYLTGDKRLPSLFGKHFGKRTRTSPQLVGFGCCLLTPAQRKATFDVIKMSKTIQPETPDLDLLTPTEVAAILKTKVSWVYEQSRSRCKTSFPIIRLGRYFRVRRSDLIKWVEAQRA